MVQIYGSSFPYFTCNTGSIDCRQHSGILKNDHTRVEMLLYGRFFACYFIAPYSFPLFNSAFNSELFYSLHSAMHFLQ